jgi:inhibitor of cysteine peptidase
MRKHTGVAVLVLAAVLVIGLVAGCGSSSTSTSKSSTTKPSSSTSSGKTYTKADKDIAVAVGQEFTIELESNASTGYSWQLTGPLSPAVVKVSNKYVPGPNADKLAGAPGTEKWVFKGVSAGDAVILMQYMPPGTGGQPGDTVNISVTVGGTAAPTSSMKTYTKADKNITVKAGQEFAIVLDSNPTTGYTWNITGPLSPAVVKVSNTYTPGPNAQKLEGAGGTDKWVFKGVSAGDALIQMEYLPPGTGGQPGETDVFNVTVN